VADLGEGPGDPGHSPLNLTERRKDGRASNTKTTSLHPPFIFKHVGNKEGEKNKNPPPPPPLAQGLDPPLLAHK